MRGCLPPRKSHYNNNEAGRSLPNLAFKTRSGCQHAIKDVKHASSSPFRLCLSTPLMSSKASPPTCDNGKLLEAKFASAPNNPSVGRRHSHTPRPGPRPDGLSERDGPYTCKTIMVGLSTRWLSLPPLVRQSENKTPSANIDTDSSTILPDLLTPPPRHLPTGLCAPAPARITTVAPWRGESKPSRGTCSNSSSSSQTRDERSVCTPSRPGRTS